MEYNSNTGIRVGEQAQLVLEANHCADNGHSGISYGEQAGGVARENICVRNGAHGIIVTGQAQPTLERNHCTENAETGIVYSGEAEGMAYENECLWNERNGITVSGHARPENSAEAIAPNGRDVLAAIALSMRGEMEDGPFVAIRQIWDRFGHTSLELRARPQAWSAGVVVRKSSQKRLNLRRLCVQTGLALVELAVLPDFPSLAFGAVYGGNEVQ